MSLLIQIKILMILVIIYLSDNGFSSPSKRGIASSSSPFLGDVLEPIEAKDFQKALDRCIKEIEAKFNPFGYSHRDAFDHARTAITDLTKYQDLHPYVRRYYNSFEPHLNQGIIKNVDKYCETRDNPNLCVRTIKDEFKSIYADKTIHHAFYYTNDALIQISKKDDLISYFSSIHRGFQLFLNATLTRSEFRFSDRFCRDTVNAQIIPNHFDLNQPYHPSETDEV